jgi:hypothetical protein
MPLSSISCERHLGLRRLADRFVVQDRARDVIGQPRCCQQYFAIGAPMFFAVLDADRVEAL